MPTKGYTMPPEWRAKIAAASLGKPKSAEARANMSVAAKLRVAEKRNQTCAILETCKHGHDLNETRVLRGVKKDPRCKICLQKRSRKSMLKTKFGLTLADYAAMIAAQGDKCAICGGVDSKGRALALDHNHVTGKVRGLLCDRCNTTLGKVQDSTETLKAMIQYLEERG